MFQKVIWFFKRSKDVDMMKSKVVESVMQREISFDDSLTADFNQLLM